MKKKLVDAGDFFDIVENNEEIIDLAKLRRLAKKIYPEGGDKISQFVADAKAGWLPKLRWVSARRRQGFAFLASS